jgi:hypothetical protein
MISVILNAYKRVDYLEEQINKIQKQTIEPKEILVWYNNDQLTNLKKKSDITYCDCSSNLGVWARFSLALNCKSPYIAIFDDDTFPGKNWFKNCLETLEKFNGLLGTRGVKFSSTEKYFVGEEHGWNNPNDKTEEVDIVGHAWFFRREWLQAFWRELPEISQSRYVGEDIHFSYSLQKYLNLKTYVPPHPKKNKELWGSDPEIAMKLGTDSNSISYNTERQTEMNLIYLSYLKKGFNINPGFKLKTKGKLKEAKSKIGHVIKKL